MHETTSSLDLGRTVTLEAASRSYLEHLRLLGRSEQTIRARRNGIRQFGKSWGDRDLREATSVDLEGYALALRERVSRETAYTYLDGVRALFRFLTTELVILVDPAKALPMPKMRGRKIGKVFTPEEMNQLVESPNIASPVGLRDRALLEFLYSTGLRAGEAMRMTVQEVGDDVVTVHAGKGNKDRCVPIGRHAREWVGRYLTEARPKLARPEVTVLWVADRGRPFGDAWFRRYVSLLGQAAGLVGVTCHAIRRSMATHLLAAGASPAEVSPILGHSDLGSLSRYASLTGVELKEAHAETHPREVQP